jgi:pantothenate synthetase
MTDGLEALYTQRVLYLPLLVQAQANLSPTASLGHMIRLEEGCAAASKEITAAIASRRQARALKRALPGLTDLCAVVGAEELGDAIAAALQGLARAEEDKLDGVAAAHAVLVLDAIDRARLAAGITIDLCTAFGVAPNGFPLPDEPSGRTPPAASV